MAATPKDDKCNMKIMRKHVVNKLSPYWSVVCQHLGYSTADLQENDKKNLITVLEHWINSGQKEGRPKTWSMFIGVLSNISELSTVTSDIYRNLNTAGVYITPPNSSSHDPSPRQSQRKSHSAIVPQLVQDNTSSLTEVADGGTNQSTAGVAAATPPHNQCNIKAIHKHVASHLSPHWIMVCHHLGYSTAQRDRFRSANDKKSLIAVLEHWIKSGEKEGKPRTWSMLIGVLSNISELSTVTSDICRDLNTAGIYITPPTSKSHDLSPKQSQSPQLVQDVTSSLTEVADGPNKSTNGQLTHPTEKPLNMQMMYRHVVSKLSPYWTSVGDYLEYSVTERNNFKGPNNNKSLAALLENWITTTNGRQPKTWSTFFKVLRELDEDLSMSVGREICASIQAELAPPSTPVQQPPPRRIASYSSSPAQHPQKHVKVTQSFSVPTVNAPNQYSRPSVNDVRVKLENQFSIPEENFGLPSQGGQPHGSLHQSPHVSRFASPYVSSATGHPPAPSYSPSTGQQHLVKPSYQSFNQYPWGYPPGQHYPSMPQGPPSMAYQSMGYLRGHLSKGYPRGHPSMGHYSPRYPDFHPNKQGQVHPYQQQYQRTQPGETKDGAAVAFAYEQAIKQGVHEANQFKIVMLGAEGAGKSCTVHSLLGKKFQPHQPSTIGADTHTADTHNNMTADRVFSCDWRTRELQHHQYENSLRFKCEIKEEITKTLNNESQNNKQHNDDVGLEVLQSKTEAYNKVSESAGLEVLQSNIINQDDKVRIVIYDLGGQEIYYEIQYLFLASHDVVLLTFNASVSLDEPVVRRHRYTVFQRKYKTRESLTTYEVIVATLHTIYSHCGVEGNEMSLSPRNPTVIMIATHSFNLTPDEKKSIADTLLHRLPIKLRDHIPKSSKNAIHFIDNEKRDAAIFNSLKAVIVEAAKFACTEKRPISYLKFENSILAESQKNTEVSIEKAFSIARDAGLESTNEALKAVLQYYTFRGILLYYPDVEALNSTIFVSPQRISDLITCVIRTHDYAEPTFQADLHNKCVRFDKYGLLEETLIEGMTERSGHSKNTVLGLLEKFELAIEIDRGTKFTNEPDSYLTPDSGRVFFGPSMLVHNEIQHYIPPKGRIVNTMLYYFPDEFIPDTVFNHVLILVTKYCYSHGHRIHSVYNGIGVFDFSNNSQSFTLERHSDTYSIKCHINVCKQELHNKDFWQQRLDLLDLIEGFINSVHTHCIPNTAKPIAYVECPLPHDKECGPHIRRDAIKPKTFCNIFNEYISVDVYNLLLEPTNQSVCVSTGIIAATPVRGAVIFHEIKDKEKTPDMKDLHHHVIKTHALHWREIGLQLKLKITTLDIIDKDNPLNCTACFERTLQKWLDLTPNATWRELEVAITNATRAHLGLKPVTDIYGIDE